MKEFLGKIRTSQKSYSIPKQVLISMGILLFGVFMGGFSKYLDYRQANLPALMHLMLWICITFLGNLRLGLLSHCALPFAVQPLLGLVSMFLPLS